MSMLSVGPEKFWGETTLQVLGGVYREKGSMLFSKRNFRNSVAGLSAVFLIFLLVFIYKQPSHVLRLSPEGQVVEITSTTKQEKVKSGKSTITSLARKKAQKSKKPAQDNHLAIDGKNYSSHTHCRLPKCTDYFSAQDEKFFEYCSKRQRKRHRSDRDFPLTGDCRFMRGEGRAPVALASLPGSGNTWVRGLLEKATGICTGSVYCDVKLKEGGFNGESVRSGSVLVVKTHTLSFSPVNKSSVIRDFTSDCGALILLLRNPYHAIVSERNRKLVARKLWINRNNRTVANMSTNSHVLSVSQNEFVSGNTLSHLMESMMNSLENLIKNVILESPETVPKLVVRYEDFQRDRVREVSRVLDFLNFPYSLDTLSQRLEEDFSVFHRKKHPQFQVFTLSQELFIEQRLRDIQSMVSETLGGEKFGMEEYITINFSNITHE